MNKKQTIKHHRSLFSIGFVAIAGGIVALVLATSTITSTQSHTKPQPQVLAYATNVSRDGLLASTNQDRSANGLAVLGMNDKLNNAAQAKANDMVAKNYWSHTSPDGRQPWDFMSAAGYQYRTAGENLEYGATDSASVEQAWMNSPGHRANILNSEFVEVGFGYANSENFVNNGNQTGVVAMYAAPYSATPAPQPAPQPEPTPAPAPSPEPAPQPAPQPVPSSPTPEPQPTAPQQQEAPLEQAQATDTSPVSESDKKSAPSTENEVDGKLPIAASKTRRVEAVSGINSPWLVAGVAVIGLIAAGAFLYRHSRRWHRWIIKGEQFIIHHVVLDIAILALAVAVVYLLQTVVQVL